MHLSFLEGMRVLHRVIAISHPTVLNINQLTPEQLVTKTHKAYPKREWQNIRDRNEALECSIYARSASIAIGIDRRQLSKWDSLMGWDTKHPGTL